MAKNHPTRICRHCNQVFEPRCPSQFYCCVLCSFFDKIDIKTTQECWIWKACKDKDGYGLFTINKCQIRAHRFMIEIQQGMLFPKYQVLHKCDNPPCVNPKHLYVGLHQDNVNDAVKKDRHTRGERSTQAKLTDEKVLQILKDFKCGKPNIEIAKRFGVHRATIWGIRCNDKWKHIHN